MSIEREIFYQKVAQTTSSPIGVEVSRAEGCYMYTPEGKPYLDLIRSGSEQCGALPPKGCGSSTATSIKIYAPYGVW